MPDDVESPDEASAQNLHHLHEEEAEEAELTEDELQDNVLDLKCKQCSRLLSQRGMRVRLVSDASISLFSTDFRPDVQEVAEQREHGLCRCCVRDVRCACGCTVGYHVIVPCAGCASSSHNDHYWLFDQGNVQATDRQTADGLTMLWPDLPHEALGHSQADKEAVVEPTEMESEACCPICHEGISEPVAPPCGHAACQHCLTRAVDLRRECPYCRMATTCAELTTWPVHQLKKAKHRATSPPAAKKKNSPTSTPANRNSSISPISNSPYDNCNTYNDGSATASSSSPQGMYMSRLPTIPSTTEYPGDWGFEISFGPLTESASKSATWTYSDVCKKLYVNLASFCPIKFKTRMQPPSGTVLRAVAVFKGSTNLHDVVKRCPNHMESSNDGSAPKDQFIRSNNPAAHYHTCPESMRHSVMLPYNGPQVGTEFVTEMFAFMCFSSCASGPSRRPVEVIFTLEKDGQTLGRRVVEIRVCACPGRDRKSDEKAVCGEPTSSQGVGKRARRGSGNKGPGAKRRRTSSRTSSEEEYVVTTRNRHVYELLMDFKEKLEDKFEYFHLQNLDNSLVLSTSEDETEQPSTSAGSPGSVFKRGGLSTM